MGETRVMNRKWQAFDVYIGRGSLFGNPYYIGKDGTRSEVIEKYRAWFKRKVANERGFKDALESLRGKRLGCYCKPLACHGDVIVEYLNATK